ncbi:MAG: GldG family protein [Candidatus Omnitrophica bacterium]|nr:GldG family protein [Candidatus Omnitrophota bacterium]
MRKERINTVITLFALGCLCLIISSAKSFIDYHFSLSASVLFVAGIISVAASFLMIKPNSEAKNKTYFLKSFSPYLFSFLLLVFLFLVNAGVAKKDIRFDMTKGKQHTLSPYTADFISKLGEDIKITVFYVGIAPKYLEDLLKEFNRISKGRINTEIIDPLENIGYASSFGNVISGKESKAFVQSLRPNGIRKEIDFSDGVLAEGQLVNEINRLIRPALKVYFLMGHGEADYKNESEKGFSKFAELLSKNNFIPRILLLGTGNIIPEDCAVLIVAGAKEELGPKEEDAINDFLLKGGDVLFLIENVLVSTPDKPLSAEEMKKNPSLNGILNRWGMNVGDDIVVDIASHISGDPGSPATKNYFTHRAIVKNLDYTFYVRPRSISFKSGRRGTIKLAPLVSSQSAKESWGEKDRYLDVKYNPGVDTTGPVPLAFVAWEPQEGKDSSDTRLVVFTDSDFLSNNFIDYYSNAEMGLNTVNWLSEADYITFADKKKADIEKLNLTSGQKRVIGVILLIMPAIIAVIGICVWLKTGVK